MASIATHGADGRRTRRGEDDWRNYVNSQEAFDLEALDKNIAKLDRDRVALATEVAKIRNRCLQRRRYRNGGGR